MKTNIIIALLTMIVTLQAASLLKPTETPVNVDPLTKTKVWFDANCPSLKKSMTTPGGFRVSHREPMLCGHIATAHPQLVLD